MKYAGWIVAAAVVLLALTQGRQTAGPMEPVPVGITVSVHPDAANSRLIWRLWSDGQVDATFIDITCVKGLLPCATGVVIPGTCPGDITHDGAVATADLLGVLETWGPCE